MADYAQFDDDDVIDGLTYDSKGNLDYIKKFASSAFDKVNKVAKAGHTNFIQDTLIRRKTSSPMFEYLWRVEMPNLSNTGTDMDVNIRVTSVDAPMQQFETKKHAINSTFFHSASHREVGNVTVKIDEFEDHYTMKYLEDWMNSIRLPNGLYNSPANYKKNIKLIKVSNTNLDLHYTLFEGCFPTSIAPINYNYEATGIVSYHVTFAVTDVKHFILGKAVVEQMTGAMQGAFSGSPITGFGQFSVGGIASEIYDTVGGFIKDAGEYLGEFGKSVTGDTEYGSFGAGDVITGLTY